MYVIITNRNKSDVWNRQSSERSGKSREVAIDLIIYRWELNKSKSLISSQAAYIPLGMVLMLIVNKVVEKM